MLSLINIYSCLFLHFLFYSNKAFSFVNVIKCIIRWQLRSFHDQSNLRRKISYIFISLVKCRFFLKKKRPWTFNICNTEKVFGKKTGLNATLSKYLLKFSSLILEMSEIFGMIFFPAVYLYKSLINITAYLFSFKKRLI